MTAHRVDSYDTVFLIGSGVNTNPWVPVVSALQEFAPYLGSTCGEHANFWLALHVFTLRVAGFHRRSRNASHASAAHMITLKKTDRLVRETIAAKLRRATERGDFFGVRPEFARVLEHPRWRNFTFLTTNWDRNVEEQLGFDVTHLHGDVSDSNCLYLPTETSHEPYRSSGLNKRMRLSAGTAWRRIRGAKQVCIYGLSLSPLDAELAITLGMGLEPRPGPPITVYVYNLRGPSLDEAVWRVRAATHPLAKVDIRPMPLDAGSDPPVPKGWDLRG